MVATRSVQQQSSSPNKVEATAQGGGLELPRIVREVNNQHVSCFSVRNVQRETVDHALSVSWRVHRGASVVLDRVAMLVIRCG